VLLQSDVSSHQTCAVGNLDTEIRESAARHREDPVSQFSWVHTRSITQDRNVSNTPGAIRFPSGSSASE
jgi:hypothetical protein